MTAIRGYFCFVAKGEEQYLHGLPGALCVRILGMPISPGWDDRVMLWHMHCRRLHAYAYHDLVATLSL
jgi:hypothetical protein